MNALVSSFFDALPVMLTYSIIVSVRDPLHGRGDAADLLALPARQSRLPPTRHGGGGAATLPPLPTAVPSPLTPHLPATAAAATTASSKKTRGRGAVVKALACYIFHKPFF